MKAIIDRFEDNNLAVLELNDQPGNMLTVSRNELPSNACQGDILYYQNGGWTIAEEETIQRQTSNWLYTSVSCNNHLSTAASFSKTQSIPLTTKNTLRAHNLQGVFCSCSSTLLHVLLP